MNRLEHILQYAWKIPDYCKNDIETLRSEVPEISKLSDKTIYGLYHNWGEYCYSASWFNPGTYAIPHQYVDEFRTFLLEKENGADWIFDGIEA